MTIRMTRRSALLGSAAVVATLQPAAAQRAAPADRIWSGGPILTMNDARMRAEAVAERRGRIVAVGSVADVMRLRGPRTQMIDLGGRAMVPGFIDAHGHIAMGGMQALSANLLPPPDGDGSDIASLQKILRDWIAANAEAIRKVNLIVGFGYDNAQLKELRHPTRDDLDAVSRDVPIVILHQSGHLGVLNSKALEIAGISAATPEFPGGVVRRKTGGKEPDGVLEETALIAGALKVVASVGPGGLKAFIKAGAELWARFGYTTAQEGRAIPLIADMIREVAKEGGFKNDVAVFLDVIPGRDYILANRSATYRNRVRIAGGKLSLDGSPQGFTALRDRPYYNPVGNYPPGYAGYATATLDDAVKLVDWSYEHKVPLLTHCNGEGSSDMYIAALRAAQAKHGGGDRRAVLIHGQFMREDQVDSYKDLGVIPSLFPMHTFYWGDWHRDHTVGPQAADNLSPTGWVRQRGMIFTSHHDAPVALPNSMRVLAATVTRRSRSGDILGPWQRVDVVTALKAMTIWSAHQHFEEKNKGSIEVGKLADFAILSADPTAIDPETLSELKVTESIKEGRTIFSLTAEQRRRGDLMLPDGLKDDPFQRFINAAAVYSDMMRAPNPFMRGNPNLAKAMAASPHDRACVGRFMDDLVVSMTLSAADGTSAARTSAGG
jgi:predicted amidohydrolase YtcJ